MISRHFLALAGAWTLVCAAISACSPEGGSSSKPPPPKPEAAAPVAAPGQLTPEVVNAARFTVDPADAPARGGSTTGPGQAAAAAPDPVLIRAEVLLDRAKFSPGVIDGLDGQNFRNALKAFEAARHLPGDGRLTPQTWAALTADAGPVLTTYTIAPADVSGPWSPDVGEDMVKLSDQKATGFHRPLELLGEKFHMDEGLLKALNPNADFARAGTRIVVAAPGQPMLAGQVKRIEIDKAREQVRAFDADDRLVAVYPATVGSTSRPSPVGTFKVNGVSRHPDYMYDPAKLTWGPRHAGKLHIPPGPNNPVGTVWIDLSAPDYGIHGSPDPRLIGKTASHGCVRLTNWDVEALASATKAGAKAEFLSGKASRSSAAAGEDAETD